MMKTLVVCTVNSDKDVLNAFMHDIEVSEIIIFSTLMSRLEMFEHIIV